MKVSEEKIQQIRDTADIAEVISDYVTLRKKGKSLMGLCPFHQEKTPSFSVDPGKGLYHCFGCGAGGDIFNFIMDIENITFPEAVKNLAERYGISLPESRTEDASSYETEILFYTNNTAKDFFTSCLYQTRAGAKALSYIKQRGFTSETIKKFQIGYAPNRWDGLILLAQRSNLPLQHLEKAGLIIKRRNGSGFYDRFRGRIIFPITNTTGKVIGFGGRIIKQEKNQPKYINSPETRIYKKGFQLYGLDLAKKAIRHKDRILLVEGYTDVMRLHQNDFNNAVSTLGTALTVNQAQILARYSKNVTLLFDGDSAGFKAALRGVDVLFKAGIRVNIAPLPHGIDPDSYLLQKGQKIMNEHIQTAQSFVEFHLQQLKKNGSFNSPYAKAEAAKNLLNTVRNIKDPLEKNFYIKEISEKIGVDEKFLHEQQLKKTDRITSTGQETNQKHPENAEDILLIFLLQDFIKWVNIIFDFIQEDDITSHTILLTIYRDYSNHKIKNVNDIMNRFNENPEIKSYLTALMTRRKDTVTKSDDYKKLCADCIIEIKKRNLKNKIKTYQEQIRRQQQNNKNVNELQDEYFKLKKELVSFSHDMKDMILKKIEKKS
ncbi:MAG: DNA primase [bacterium]